MPDWLITAYTRRGRGRSHNQDCVGIGDRVFTGDMQSPETMAIANDRCILLLADGMGGHVHGAHASSSVVAALTSVPEQIFFDRDLCVANIRNVNAKLYRLMDETPGARGMGSTLVGMALSGANLAIFNIGDSPAFIHRPGELLELSVRDTPGVTIAASKPSSAHQVTQSLGGTSHERAISPHYSIFRPDWSQDVVLLTSDGLTDTVDESTIAIIIDQSKNPDFAVEELYRTALSTGGRDDVSIVLARRSRS